MMLGDVMVLVGYSDCETDCCIVLSDYLIMRLVRYMLNSDD